MCCTVEAQYTEEITFWRAKGPTLERRSNYGAERIGSDRLSTVCCVVLRCAEQRSAVGAEHKYSWQQEERNAVTGKRRSCGNQTSGESARAASSRCVVQYM